jgi:hypothetical protein
MDEIETLSRPEGKRCEEKWRDFFKLNCNALFQTALLLTADPVTAEAALAKSIDELDMSRSPQQVSFAAWEQLVVMRSIEMQQGSSSGADCTTRLMLQPGLVPVIQIDRWPRMCFVIRTLLGYTTALCAQTLGIEESGIRILFQTAVIQLQQKVAGA